MASEENEFLCDIECGGTSIEEDVVCSSSSNRGKKALSRGRSGMLNFVCPVLDECDTDSADRSTTELRNNGRLDLVEFNTRSTDGFPKTIDVNSRSVEVLIDRSPGGEETRELVPLLDKRNPSDQRKKPNSKKAAKPPRPPKGPLLSDADLKLVKELSEIAARKRARNERIKALRKMKEAKKTSSSGNLTAMLITIMFFIILICQGVFSRTNVSREIRGSPAPAVAREGLTSTQIFNDAPTNEMSGPVSMSFSSWESSYSSSPREQEGRDPG